MTFFKNRFVKGKKLLSTYSCHGHFQHLLVIPGLDRVLQIAVIRDLAVSIGKCRCPQDKQGSALYRKVSCMSQFHDRWWATAAFTLHSPSPTLGNLEQHPPRKWSQPSGMACTCTISNGTSLHDGGNLEWFCAFRREPCVARLSIRDRRNYRVHVLHASSSERSEQ